MTPAISPLGLTNAMRKKKMRRMRRRKMTTMRKKRTTRTMRKRTLTWLVTLIMGLACPGCLGEYLGVTSLRSMLKS